MNKGLYVAIDLIDKDYKDTRSCNLALAQKISPMPGSIAWALAKNKSPYTKLFTKGWCYS
jgi:hypothetical protein